MRAAKAILTTVIVFSLALSSCKSSQQTAPQPISTTGTVSNGASTQQPGLQTVRAQQGGIIAYGAAPGASNQAGGLTLMLRKVHNDCGQQPMIGQPFLFTGTQMVGVFFTVANQGNQQFAGLALATLSPSNQVQAALVYDVASQIGSTVNPMLTQLFSVWNPAAPAGGQPAVQLHTVTNEDKTASVGVPDGWTMFPGNSLGLILLTGPNGEHIILNEHFNAFDPTIRNGFYQKLVQGHIQLPKYTVFYPNNVDLAQSFAGVWQALQKGEGLPSQPMQIASAQNLPVSDGEKCAHATGQLDPGAQLNPGGGMQAFDITVCADPSDQLGGGIFAYHVFEGLLPNSIAAQESATELAIMNSFQVNEALLDQIVDAKMAPILKQEQQNYNNIEQALLKRSAQIVNQIHQTGGQAGDNNAKYDQGFDNYLLDQSVVGNNSTGGHSTQWNATANQMVRANPGKYQIVNSPNYIKGTDY